MKPNRGLWILLGLTAGAVGFAVYDFSSEKSQTKIKEEKSILMPWEIDTIREIELSTSSARQTVFRLSKEKDQWRVTLPFMDLADADAVKDFLEDLSKEKSIESISEPEGIQWGLFGLDEPRGTLAIHRASGEKLTFAVSSKKNYQGDAFLRRNEEAEVLSASSAWFSMVEKTARDFQDKRILRRPTAELERVSLKAKAKFALTYKDGKWIAEERSQWALDQNKVREIVQALGGNLVSAYVLEGKVESDLPKAEVAKYNFNRPVAVIQARFKDGTTWEAKVGQDKDKNYYVLSSDAGEGSPERSARSFVAEVTSVEAEKFVNLTLDQLRNKSVPFDFPKDQVQKIELRTALKSTDLEKKGESWQLMNAANPQNKVDESKITGLITKLRDLQVTEFIDKKMELPGKPKSVFLKNAQGQSVFELHLGELQKKKINGEEKSVYLAKTNLVPELITIDEGAVSALGLEEITEGEKSQDGSPK